MLPDEEKLQMTGSAGWLRRAGLGLGTAASAFWLFAVMMGLVGPSTPWSLEAVLLAALVAFGAAALVAAWQWQGIGSLLLLIAGAALCAFAAIVAGRNQILIAILLGGPFLLSGALLRLGLARARQRTTPPDPTAESQTAQRDPSQGASHGESARHR